ncbi:hypothetical protein CsatA_030953 [Cannabis sativa]
MASSSRTMEDLGHQWADLQVEDENEVGLLFDQEEVLVDEFDGRWCLVGKLLSDRPADFDSLRNVMASLWRPGKGMYVKELETNRFLFQFFHEVDIGRVLEGTPWTFNKSLLLVERIQGGENPRTKSLNSMEIWVQVYNLEIGFRSDRVLQGVGAYIGKYVSSCPKNFAGIWRDYFRVRVQINVEKPLKRRMRIYKNKTEWFWADFKYERVPTFCFICGTIGHSEKFCHRLFDEPIETIAKPYGMFMKAPDRRQGKQIGARWLRDNMGQPMGSFAGQSSSENHGEGGINQNRPLRDIIMIDGVDSGEKSGDTNVERRQVRVEGKQGEDQGIFSKEINEESNEIIAQVDLFATDLKRRRINGEGQSEQLIGKEVGPDLVLGESERPINVESRPFENVIIKNGKEIVVDRGLVSSVEEGLVQVDSDACMEINNGYPQFRATGFYGEPQRSLRPNSWQAIRQLSGESSLPWCLLGDLNNTLNHSDKRGGRPYPNWLLTGFQDVVSECHLIDMELRGHPYTWEKGRGTDQWVEVRLDRALISHDWQTLFPSAFLENLEITVSDHCPIWVNLSKSKPVQVHKKFRYENAWSREPMCRQIVQANWEDSSIQSLHVKLTSCSSALAEWGRDITGNFNKQIRQCNKALKLLKGRRDLVSVSRYKEIQAQLSEVLSKKEVFWRQRSKQLWLQAGDQNTKYFHACASTRKRSNQIDRLKNDDGLWVDWDNGLPDVMRRYYTELFTSSCSNWQRVIDCVVPRVSEDQNRDLLMVVEEEEVRRALFQMHPDKSPGPDGFNPGFYQKHWDIVGKDITTLVQRFFSCGEFPDYLIHTNVVLIPKKSHPESMNELRPIALCNVTYKILSKVLANRLKGILTQVISETQSPFLPGRLITDNILISYEIMHYLKRKQKGKQGFMAIKLDMSKAYDRVEWGFLEAMMKKLGFHDQCIRLILKCVSSVAYKFVVGEHEVGPIVPSRGLRQGDPLSPYLFLLCAEGFSALLHDFERRGKIRGCKVARGAPLISHMLFADDSYIYCQASEDGARNVVSLLDLFQAASGQQINCQKSSLFFSPNTSHDEKVRICTMMGIQEANENSLYLGLPNTLGRNKTAMLGFLKDRMRKKIQSWEGKFLSKAGKELLIKTVAQSLPSYAMNVFLLPVETCQEMEQLMCKFWWQSFTKNNKGIHWKSWDKLTIHKSKGGMGFRNFRDFNLSLLSKQGWRLLSFPESLVSRIFRARYYKNGNFLSAELGGNPSFVWRSIHETQDLVRNGVRCRIGNGTKVNIIRDPWLPDAANPIVTSSHPALLDKNVSVLMVPGELAWDGDLVRDLFNNRDSNLILSIPLSSSRICDSWFWNLEKTGHFTVKSTYRYLQLNKEADVNLNSSGVWKLIWKLRVPPKAKDLLWRAASDCLPTKTRLQSRHVPIQSNCPRCVNQPETPFHCLVDCPFAAQCWNCSGITLNIQGYVSFAGWLEAAFDRIDAATREQIAVTCWAIWKTRNDLVWSEKVSTAESVAVLAQITLSNWSQAQDRSLVPLPAYLSAADGSDTWQKPAATSIKINVDAAIFDSNGTYSFVCVARDASGQLVEAITCCRAGVVQPEMAEAMGVREALSWIKKKAWHGVVVESDCLSVIQAIRSNLPLLSYFGSVISDCKLLLEQIGDVSIYFIKRSANSVAHSFARASYFVADRTLLSNDVSTDLLHVIMNDCN